MKRFIPTKFTASTTAILVLAAVLITHEYDSWMEHRSRGTRPQIDSGPWGELQSWDIRLEQPLEYSSFEKTTSHDPVWNFGTLTPDDVRQVLLKAGLDSSSASALASTASNTSLGTVIRPAKETVISLPSEVRSKLYRVLAGNPANRFQNAPYFISGGDVSTLFDDNHQSDSQAISLMKKLLYKRNGFTYFSDPEVVLSLMTTPEERANFIQSLTSQTAVMARLLVRPYTDIDKPLNYWCLSTTGVLMKDLRPLLEAEKRLPEGGSVSILYLLPPLARERLFTTPLPPEFGGAKMPDCHWTALNFFSANPDARMSDNDYASRRIAEDYYEVGTPGLTGDLVLLLNTEGRVIHSAVYIADDIVFTKNGINYAQPWILVRKDSMIGSFSALDPVKVAYFRKRGR